jgi:energy-coupling factor transporter ATP-binding protein EcfA2
LFIGGASGCGKSTLARCLTGIIPHLYHGKMGGQVWLAGQRTDQSPLWELSESAGLVFQNPAAQMLASTVDEEIIFGLENLGLPQHEIERRVEETLGRFDLQGLRKRTPQTLSGGEQQKLALAAITARRPALLVLDEPLSMLDTTAAFDFMDLLAQRAMEGGASVICEHRQEYLRGLPGLQTVSLDEFPAEPAGESAIDWPDRASLKVQLEVENLSVAFGERTILNNWSFSLHGGQVTALVGRNGVGKTTLMRVLAGLQPYQGEVVVSAGSRQERADLGIVFQNPDLQLFNPTVREEILYRVDDPDNDLYNCLLDALDLRRYERSAPLLLSEGEKRRVALATVLMHRPRHGVLLDEPALGLDRFHQAHLVRVLKALAATGQLVVFSTHDIELASRADRLLLLGPQGIVADGTPAELVQREEYWSQLGLRISEWVLPAC